MTDIDELNDPELWLLKQRPEVHDGIPTLDCPPDAIEGPIDYTATPPGAFKIPLMKGKYASREIAETRARELGPIRGGKLVCMFETARAYVAEYSPVKR